MLMEFLEQRTVLTAGFSQGFEADNSGWNLFGGTNDAVRVPSGTHGVVSRTGAFHAEAQTGVIDGGGDGSAVTNFGGYTTTFPAGGFRTSKTLHQLGGSRCILS